VREKISHSLIHRRKKILRASQRKKRGEKAGKERETHVRCALCHLPIEPIDKAGDEGASTDDDDVCEEAGSDVEVAGHDGFDSEADDGGHVREWA
jgi:hypothetical protein